MHPLIEPILLTVLVPAGAAAIFLLVASVVAPGPWRGAVAACGLVVAWCLGVWLAVRVPRWPPLQASDWQFYGVLASGVLVLAVIPWWRGQTAGRALAGLIFFAVFLGLIVQRFLLGLWPGPGFWLWPAGAAALALLSTAAIGAIGHSVQAAATFFTLMLFSLFVSGALTLGGAASLGHAAGVSAAACGAAWLISLLLRRQVDLLPTGFVMATLLGGLILQGVIYANLSGRAALILAMILPMAAIVALVLRRGSGSWRAALTLLVVLILGALAVLWVRG